MASQKVAIIQESNLDMAICQANSKQDFIDMFTINNMDWMVIIDGHGHHINKSKINLVTWLHQYDWRLFLGNFDKNYSPRLNPINIIQEKIGLLFKCTSGIGATMSIVRIIDNKKVTIWWRGDSSVKIYENNKFIGGTKDISITMQKEKDRLENQGINYVVDDSSYRPHVLSARRITMKPSYYISFNINDKLMEDRINMSQSIGHNGGCGFSDNRVDYNLNKINNYKIVGGSDGLWDVFGETEEENEIIADLNTSASDLVNLALERWEQEWEYEWYGKVMQKERLQGRDDICCGIYKIINK